MNKVFAAIAVILCLIAHAPASAQDNRGANSNRSLQTGRTSAPTASSRRTASSRPAEARPPATRPTTTRRTASRSAPVTTASHEHIVSGDVYYDDGPIISEGCSSCGGGGCDNCSLSSGACNTCAAPSGFCICFPAHGWVHAEYLLWYPSGMQTPELVTTSTANTARTNTGVLGLPTTSVLYGGDEIMTDDRSGFRIRFGWWLAAFPNWGVEGEYTGLEEETESFFAASTGTPTLARPFFNALDGREDAELIAFPSVINGNIAVDTTSKFEGAAVRFRRQMCCTTGCGYSNLYCQTVPISTRLDSTVGYRFWELKESLQARERLASLLPAPDQGNFDIIDRFETRNQFNGGEVGVIWQGRRGWWSLDALMRVAIGNVHQTVTIDGSTAITENGATVNYDNGLLAQSTNIGTYDRDKFTMVPEFGATIGYQMTRRLRMTAGYSLIYWGNVVRPGDQVDLNVNTNLLAPTLDPLTGPLRPQFNFVETDYWVQGLNFGGEFRW